MSGIVGDNIGRSSGLIKSSAVSVALKKTYHVQFQGGQSLSSFDMASPSIVSNYQLAITPSSSSSVFLATYNINLHSAGDHTNLKVMAKVDGGSYVALGRAKASMENDAGFYDFGTFKIVATAQPNTSKSQSFYYAPATATEITFALYAGQHGGTAYFGKAEAGDGDDDDYSAIGMSLRVDEYNSTSELVATEFLNG